MSETKSQNLKDVEIKLKNLLKSILDKAAADSEFAQQLKEILLSDSSSKVVSANKSRIKKNNFNDVEYLHLHGEVKLRDELDRKTDTELKNIFRAGGIGKGKNLKNIERKQLIDEIVTNADRTLKQGSSFL